MPGNRWNNKNSKFYAEKNGADFFWVDGKLKILAKSGLNFQTYLKLGNAIMDAKPLALER